MPEKFLEIPSVKETKEISPSRVIDFLKEKFAKSGSFIETKKRKQIQILFKDEDEVVEASERERFGWYFALRTIRRMRDEGLPLEKYFKDNQELREYYHKYLKEWYEYYKENKPELVDLFTRSYREIEYAKG